MSFGIKFLVFKVISLFFMVSYCVSICNFGSVIISYSFLTFSLIDNSLFFLSHHKNIRLKSIYFVAGIFSLSLFQYAARLECNAFILDKLNAPFVCLFDDICSSCIFSSASANQSFPVCPSDALAIYLKRR